MTKKMKKLTKERITEIVDNSEDIFKALLGLYEDVISPVKWYDLENIKPTEVHINRVTSEFIVEEMHRKFSKEGDYWPVNGLILNKGFSCNHEEVPEWKVRITKDCYTVKKDVMVV